MRVAAFEARVARDLLAYLHDLEAGKPPFYKDAGLCANFTRLLRWRGCDTDEQLHGGHLLEELLTRWPWHSGYAAFAVPSCDPYLVSEHGAAKAAKLAYLYIEDKWSTDTAYGQARWRLVAWLRQELEEALPLLDVLEEV